MIFDVLKLGKMKDVRLRKIQRRREMHVSKIDQDDITASSEQQAASSKQQRARQPSDRT